MHAFTKALTSILKRVKSKHIFNYVVIFIAGSLFTSCHNNDFKKQTDWEKRGLKGKVFILKERHYLAKMEFGDDIRCSNELYTGNEICGFNFDSIFPAFNSLVPMINGPLGIEANEDLKFLENGVIYREIHYNNKGIEWFHQYEYDEKNRKIKEVSSENVSKIDKDGGIWSRNRSIDSIVYKGNESYLYHHDKYSPKPYLWVYSKYDDYDNVIEEIRYSPSKVMGNRTVNQYDSKGQRVSSICYGSLNNIIDQEVTKYANNVIVTDNDGLVTTTTYIDSTYNKKLYEENSIDNQAWKYDEKGNVIYWQREDGDFSYKYEYDSEGNWVKRVKYNAKYKSPEEITEREIQYYSGIDYLYLRVAITFLVEFTGIIFVAGLSIITLVYLFYLLLFPFKIKIKKNDKTTKYVTYVFASIAWLITGAILGSVFHMLLEVINVWACIVLYILYFSICFFLAYETQGELKDNLNFYNLVNKIIVKEHSGEITKISLIKYYALQCTFFAILSFLSYSIYVYVTGNNPINYQGLYLKAYSGDFKFIFWGFVIGTFVLLIVSWGIYKYKKIEFKNNQGN